MTHAVEPTSEATSAPRRGRWPRRPMLALIALCLAFFVVQLDVTVVNVAVEAVRHDLGGGLGGQQWIVASYTVVLAAGMLTAGALGDRCGARRVCVLGLITFAGASALCSLAPSLPALIAARAVQGVGAAALLPCSLALIVQQFPDPRQRAHALGVWGGIAGIGMAAGPVVGGALVALAGWRSIFLVNVPFCAVTVFMTCRWVSESSPRRGTKLDLWGLVVATVALAALTGGLIEAGQLGWVQPIPVALVLGGLLAGAALINIERRHPEPMLPLRIFAARRFSAATAAGALFNFCLYGTLLCVSLFLQGPLRQAAPTTGLMILPVTVAVGIGATISGRLTARFGPGVPMLIGYSFGAAGAALLMATGPSGPLPLVVLGSVTLGFCSIAMPAMTSVVMSGVAGSHTGLASGVLNTARQAGGALGTAVLGALLTVDAAGSGMLLRAPMLVALTAYAVAIGCTLLATKQPSKPPNPKSARPAPTMTPDRSSAGP